MNDELIGHEEGPAGATYTVYELLGPGERNAWSNGYEQARREAASGDTVTIPRAQHEAYRAAASDLFDWAAKYDDGRCKCGDCVLRRETLAALRDVGIEPEG